MIVSYVIVTPLHYKSVRRLSRPRRPVVPSLVGPVLFVDARLLSKDGAVSMSTRTTRRREVFGAVSMSWGGKQTQDDEGTNRRDVIGSQRSGMMCPCCSGVFWIHSQRTTTAQRTSERANERTNESFRRPMFVDAHPPPCKSPLRRF